MHRSERPTFSAHSIDAIAVWSRPAVLLLVLLLCSRPAAVRAGTRIWTTSGPPAPVATLVLDPSRPATVYVDGGSFRSTDGGGSWSVNVNGVSAHSMVIDPVVHSTLYAGGEGGVFKSTNSAATWTPMNAGLTNNFRTATVYAVAIDPETPATLYAGTDGNLGAPAVYKTTDGALTWTRMGNGFPAEAGVETIVIDPKTPSTLYAASIDDGVFKSTDGGATWLVMNNGIAPHLIQIGPLAIDPVTPTTIYAGTQGGVYKSTNGAASWTLMSDSLGVVYELEFPTRTSVESLAIDPRRPSTLYAGTGFGGIFKTTDAGATWAAFNVGLPVLSPYGTFATIHALVVDPVSPSTVYLGTSSTNGGVYRIDQQDVAPTQSPTATFTPTARPTDTTRPTSTPISTATAPATVVPPTTASTATDTATALSTPTSAATPHVACAGDCNGTGEVTINELLLGVNIALGSMSVAACPAFGKGGEVAVTVADLVRAVGAALNGCPLAFTPTVPPGTASPMPTATARFVDNGDGTITDLKTNLTWEQKREGGGCLHCADDVYAWEPGLALSGTPSVFDWLAQVNGEPQLSMSFGLGGHSDWRLPSRDELWTLVDCGRGPICIDSMFRAASDAPYWTFTTRGDEPSRAWEIGFYLGLVYDAPKHVNAHVIAVRGGQPVSIPGRDTPRFIDHFDGTVTDTATGLMWETKVPGTGCPRCVEDRYAWEPGRATSTSPSMWDWVSQLNGYFTGVGPAQPGLAGYSDWRIPSRAEMESVVDCSNSSPCIDPAFGSTATGLYWTSTTLGQTPSKAWKVGFGAGNVSDGSKNTLGYVRAVRGAP